MMMSPAKVYRNWVLPGIVPVGVIVVTLAIIIVVGEILLSVYEHGTPELERLDLYIATGGAILILGVSAFLATRPAGALGPLDQELAFGKRPMLAEPLPPVDVSARRGALGTIDDIERGYALYARNGQLAVAQDLLKGVPGEVSHLRKGFIYAQGVHGANDQIWIPIEAVSAVYPETRSAFLAIAGDEIEAYGWQKPPASFNLLRKDTEQRLY